MNDAPAEIRLPKLLLEAEAAALLRRSRGHVKRLRLERKLAYIPNRPVTIIEKDLEFYVARAKVRRVKARDKSKTFEYVSVGASSKPFALLTTTEAAAKFGRTARQIRYLCLRGRVPYILGRPPLIDEADLAEYLENKRLAAMVRIPPAPGTPEFEALQKRKAKEKGARRLRQRTVNAELRAFWRRWPPAHQPAPRRAAVTQEGGNNFKASWQTFIIWIFLRARMQQHSCLRILLVFTFPKHD
jgi:hypothetical protein